MDAVASGVPMVPALPPTVQLSFASSVHFLGFVSDQQWDGQDDDGAVGRVAADAAAAGARAIH